MLLLFIYDKQLITSCSETADIEIVFHRILYHFFGDHSARHIHQLQMVIESYRTEYSKQMDEMFKKQNIKTNVSVEKEGQIKSK